MYRIIRQPDAALGYSYMPQVFKTSPLKVFSRWTNLTTIPYAKQDDAEEFVERFALAQAGTTVVKQYGSISEDLIVHIEKCGREDPEI